MDQGESRDLKLERPVDLGLTLRPLWHGPGDPCTRLGREGVLRATRTPEGPGTLRIDALDGTGSVRGQAWGSGSGWLLERLADLVGANDDDAPLTTMLNPPRRRDQIVLRDLQHRLNGLRIPRTGAVTEALVPALIGQKVTTVEADRSYRQLTIALGEPAPGPSDLVRGLMLPPPPKVLSATPYWRFHRFGIEKRRADTIRLACSNAARLEELSSLPPIEVQAVLMELPGIGPWTAAHVALMSLGDPDAVTLGDFHIPHQVAWAFTGAHRSDDETMLQILEPYRGQRGRVIRLIVAGGIGPPRRGPRAPIRSFRDM